MDTWSGPNEVGSDWGGFKDVFSTGKAPSMQSSRTENFCYISKKTMPMASKIGTPRGKSVRAGRISGKSCLSATA